jgi:hypothetical protein
MVGIKPAGIRRGVLDDFASLADAPDRVIHQPPHVLLLEQTAAGFLQRREVGNGL